MPRLRAKSRPRLPTVENWMFSKSAPSSTRKRCPRRMMLELNPPHSPRSEVIITSSTRRSGRTAMSGWGGRSASARARASEASISSMSCAYGRARTTASCARRSLAAATIFMALVIFCVFRTERMRVRMARSESTLASGRLLRRRAEDVLELAERLVERLAHVVRQVLLLAQRPQDFGVASLHEVDELAHVALHVADFEVADPDDAL